MVYVGLGLVLSASALMLPGAGAIRLGRGMIAGILPLRIVDFLDQFLLVVMIVEILNTVQISFRHHALEPAPFLIIGLVATTRRILVLTAELKGVVEQGSELVFRNAMIELALLTVGVCLHEIQPTRASLRRGVETGGA